MKHTWLKLILIMGLFALPQALFGQIYPDRPTGHVNDLAGFMSASEVSRLESKLRAFRDSTSNVIAILTLESLQGETVEYVAERVFNTWRMWEGDRQNGVLILAARQERALRIEVGYGLEGAIPDILAGQIIREILTPGFRQEQYGSAFNAATDQLMRLAAGEYEAVVNPEENTIESNVDDAIRVFFLFVLIMIFIVVMIIRAKLGGPGGGHHIRRGGVIVIGTPGFGRGGFGGGFGGGGFGRSGGFGGGGFGGFSGGGGFGSGGGGASGGW